MPVPQGGGGADGSQGSDGSDSTISLPGTTEPVQLSGAVNPTTPNQRTTAQTRQLQTNPQTIGQSVVSRWGTQLNPLTLGQDTDGPGGGLGGLDTSLRKILPGGSPTDTARRESKVTSTFNGKLAPPGVFAEPRDGQPGWPWEYIERIPPESSLGLGGSMKFPQLKVQNQDQTRLSSPYNSNPPTVRLSGMQEGIFRKDMQPGKAYSRNTGPQNTTPLGSSRHANYTPGKLGNTGRGSPRQTSAEEEKQDFIESYREQYPNLAETIEYIEEEDRNMSPEKKLVEQFGFTTTPRIRVPPLVNFDQGVGGSRNQLANPEFIRGGDRKESDMLPSDLENILSQYVDTDPVEGTPGLANGGGTKASCDVTEGDCVGGENLPLASRVTRGNGGFEVRNPGRIGRSLTQRADLNGPGPLPRPALLPLDWESSLGLPRHDPYRQDGRASLYLQGVQRDPQVYYDLPPPFHDRGYNI
ncbi:hypothetical protein TWF281_001034 [Arthrobotrys megalospora]